MGPSWPPHPAGVATAPLPGAPMAGEPRPPLAGVCAASSFLSEAGVPGAGLSSPAEAFAAAAAAAPFFVPACPQESGRFDQIQVHVGLRVGIQHHRQLLRMSMLHGGGGSLSWKPAHG